MKRIVKSDAGSFAEAAADLFVEHAASAIAARGKFCVALTGGSTPVPIHKLLAQEPRKSRIDWSKVYVFFGDERAVPEADDKSNYGSAKKSFLASVAVPPSNVHRMEGDARDLDAAAEAYESVLREICEAHLDLIFVGIGKDAHILSLFPGSSMITETERLVVAEIDPPMNPAVSRITFTPPMLERARHVIALGSGAEKAEAVKAALAKEGDENKTPARLLARARDVVWVLDEAAAGKLT